MALPNLTVAHEWAHGRDAKGSNFYSEGGKLYSYYAGYIAAVIHVLPKGNVVLFNSDGYSPTTKKQLSYARRAASHIRSMEVPYPDPAKTPLADTHSVIGGHEGNLDYLKEQANELAEKSVASRSRTEDLWVAHTARVDDYNLYLRLFGVRRKEMEQLNYADVEARVAEQKVKTAASRKKAREKQALKDARYKDLWLTNDPTAPRTLRTNKTYLRVKSGILDEVQTSGGVLLPLADCKRVWLFIHRAYGTGATYEREQGDKPFKIGNFSLDKITDKGVVVSGCHTFDRAEIERFGAVLDAM